MGLDGRAQADKQFANPTRNELPAERVVLKDGLNAPLATRPPTSSYSHCETKVTAQKPGAQVTAELGLLQAGVKVTTDSRRAPRPGGAEPAWTSPRSKLPAHLGVRAFKGVPLHRGHGRKAVEADSHRQGVGGDHQGGERGRAGWHLPQGPLGILRRYDAVSATGKDTRTKRPVHISNLVRASPRGLATQQRSRPTLGGWQRRSRSHF